MESLEKKSVSSTAAETESCAVLNVQDWGLIEYESALRRQLDLVDLVHQELSRETLVFCSHPPVVTLGRGTREGDVFAWQGPVVEVNRGGRATYHGPNQIVVYPILDLNQRHRDLHRYLRALEEALVRTIADFGVTGVGGKIQIEGEENEEIPATGVWVGSKKIASIGIGVRKWVSFHGLALNVESDVDAFRGMKPCGFTPETMTSLEEILGSKPDRQAVQEQLKRRLLEALA